MKNHTTILIEKIQELVSFISSYEQGDLLGAAEIQDRIGQLCTLLEGKESLEKLHSLVVHMQPLAWALVQPGYAEEALRILQELVEGLELFITRRISGKSYGERIRTQEPLIRKYEKLFRTDQSARTEKGNGQVPTPGEGGVLNGFSEKASTTPEIEKTNTSPSTAPSSSVEEKPVRHGEPSYPTNYFDAIIEDRKLLEQFHTEAQEHLEEAQATLVELEYDGTNKELLHTIFRNFHTIKGSSAFLGLKNIEETAHSIEDLLAIVRDGKLILTKELIDIIFFGMELLKNLLDIMAAHEYQNRSMVSSFKMVNIYPYIRLLKKIKEEYRYKKIGEILEEEGKIAPAILKEILKKQESSEKKLGEIIIEEQAARPEDVVAALKKQSDIANRLKRSAIVKVSNEKLNTLIDIVGELVINQSMLKQELRQLHLTETAERSISQLETITTTIKNLVLSMGMVPIAEIFNKLRVVARNTAEELGKNVYLEVRGEDTELDRNVIETIYEPLLHLIRNSIDHGIEDGKTREERGKNRLGKIILSAEHKGSGIEIIVQDDGQGIDPERVLQKAVEKGIIKKEDTQTLSERDIYNLLFLPGFSTADQVTSVSGRGVGLDVVKKNLDSIHGRVEVRSEMGKGTCFTIKLPLTLAIIEGFVTRVGDNKYVFPFSSIEEIKVVAPEDLYQNENKEEAMIFHRGIHMPVIFSHRVFREPQKNSREQLLTLIFNFDHSHYCVVVDELIGKQEIVIKSISQNILKDCRFFSGGTIFGDGSIGFVVDMQGFLEALK
ncbi:MAG TPA: chemotaxis protein CheA [Termitinemataceae bacterium]|nr:chemotaxis protein CheA [Termitinemataceae bacterium]